VSLAKLQEHRAIWHAKPVLAEVYDVWFRGLLDALPATGTVLEVGAGPSLLAEYARPRRSGGAWLASEVLASPWNDVVANAESLPVRSETVAGIAAVDLIHHLARPARFFREAARILVPGGRLVVVEPWVTALSWPIYRWLHHEGCTLSLDPWNPFALDAGQGKDAFEGDAAVVTNLVQQTPPQVWNDLGFDPPQVTPLNGLAYLLSLGFKRGCLLPRRAVPLVTALDLGLGRLARWLGLRAQVVWCRRRSAPGR